MGKIRVKTLGDESQEQEQKKKIKEKKDQKKLAKQAEKSSDAKQEIQTRVTPDASVIENEAKSQPKKKEKFAKTREKRSAKYKTAAAKVEKNKVYKLSEAIKVLTQLGIAKFDETVELHINTTETGIIAAITLPHGSGKKVRVAIADEDIIIAIQAGKIDFDILLARPDMMPNLSKVAKILGPRGLMPNPKNGTITQNPEELAKKFENGQITVKTETKAPAMHVSVGKISFGQTKLTENITTLVNSLPAEKIKNITLKSTMSPGIRISID